MAWLRATAGVVGKLLFSLLPCHPPVQRPSKSGVLFPSLAVRCGHETEFSPIRCKWEVSLPWSEKGTWRQTPCPCQHLFLTLTAACDDLRVFVWQPPCSQEKKVKRNKVSSSNTSIIETFKLHQYILDREEKQWLYVSVRVYDQCYHFAKKFCLHNNHE